MGMSELNFLPGSSAWFLFVFVGMWLQRAPRVEGFRAKCLRIRGLWFWEGCTTGCLNKAKHLLPYFCGLLFSRALQALRPLNPDTPHPPNPEPEQKTQTKISKPKEHFSASAAPFPLPPCSQSQGGSHQAGPVIRVYSALSLSLSN